MSGERMVWTQDVVGQGRVRVMTFEPTRESLDTLIAGMRRSIDCGMAAADAGVTLLLAELLLKQIDRADNSGLPQP